MDDAYAQSLIEWMDGENGYRAQFATDDGSGNNNPPPPPPPTKTPPTHG
jgi:hypothetical protein